MARGLLCALLAHAAGACLVTDPVEFEDEINMPPVIFEAIGPDGVRIPLGSVLTADNPITSAGGMGSAGAPAISGSNELKIRLSIRDENVGQLLRSRVRVHKPGGRMIAYRCPEPEILPTNDPVREYEFSIDKTTLEIGACHRLEVAISSEFTRCHKTEPGTPKDIDRANVFFDDTVLDGDIAYASFWIWETSMDPLASPEAALLLAKSCETIDLSSRTAQIPVTTQ